MFSGHENLRRRTPANGINRKDFIGHLVEEYYTTSNIEAQEQVTANLANFAYDPINWTFLEEAGAIKLFFELFELPNEKLQLHGISGLCNICLDPHAHQVIVNPTNTFILLELFMKTQNKEILINLIALIYQLLNVDDSQSLKEQVVTPDLLRKLNYLKQTVVDQRLKNLVIVFLEDFGSRTEMIEIPAKIINKSTSLEETKISEAVTNKDKV